MIVVDTHALIWFVQGDKKLGPEAQARIDNAIATAEVIVPAICAWEVALVERRGSVRFPGGSLAWMQRVLAVPTIRLAPLDVAIAIDSVAMEWRHKDPADRMIVATARHLRAPLLTVDRKILDFAAGGHVQAIDARR